MGVGKAIAARMRSLRLTATGDDRGYQLFVICYRLRREANGQMSGISGVAWRVCSV